MNKDTWITCSCGCGLLLEKHFYFNNKVGRTVKAKFIRGHHNYLQYYRKLASKNRTAYMASVSSELRRKWAKMGYKAGMPNKALKGWWREHKKQVKEHGAFEDCKCSMCRSIRNGRNKSYRKI